MRPATILAFIIGFAAAVGGAWFVQQRQEPPLSRADVEAVVAGYLRDNPGAVIDAIKVFQAKEEAQQQEDARQLVRANADDLFRHPEDPVLGNPDGDVTLVEFFDYRCGYCKRALDGVLALADEDGQLRIVLKEFPILGPPSVLASRASLAAHRQGKFAGFHERLMRHNGDIDPGVVEAIATEAGLDLERLKADMEDPAIVATLKRNYELAETLGIRGTPAFIAGDQLVPGAVGPEKLRKLIADARKASS